MQALTVGASCKQLCCALQTQLACPGFDEKAWFGAAG